VITLPQEILDRLKTTGATALWITERTGIPKRTVSGYLMRQGYLRDHGGRFYLRGTRSVADYGKDRAAKKSEENGAIFESARDAL
jgi:hypothetical protein